ncbi:MAG TPA: GNAT family N-acetyltransferase [Clostridia bacterium]|nr:GNAT family N-acetyltransferase [Clostridia bacterium]
MEIHGLDARHRCAVNEYVRVNWGGPDLVSLGNVYDSSELPGFVAVSQDDQLLGAVLYCLDGDAMEIAALYALAEGKGVGRALMDRAVEQARAEGVRRVWLVTSNDSTRAIRFYQLYGFALIAVNLGSLEEASRIKGVAPDIGIDGIPMLHEFVFEMILDNRAKAIGRA